MFNIKFNGHYKSQLVAKEFSQIKEINFNKIFSLIIHYEIACIFLTVTTLKDWDIHSIDVKTAYLYNDLDKKIYIEQSKDLVKKRKSDNSTK